MTDRRYGCFSNFFPCSFIDPATNLSYQFSEQYFMKKKQELFDPENTALAEEIMASDRAIDIKAFGRQVRHFQDDIWESHRYNCMLEAVRYKFSQNQELKDILLSTGDSIIAEAAPNDAIWGIGISGEKAMKGKPWKGLNLLGQALMEVREELRRE